ncbi:MAG: phage Gp37/Gp68 family protein [Gammaproteobacteria bacterium]|nr:phage Gp37/Gp68 family protein [Gammaproteobacteria bacterium]MYF60219.1 phage Gp37/Gp68 family protein [Gammaproteobacteria bacterium]MYI22433.1 phage Gp37/Gp68 family protein [Gammaproteobacteria bacterium]
MADRSAIEWTDATWNPTTGCTRVSAGCDHCYAEELSRRLLTKTYCSRLPVVDTPDNRRDPFAVRTWPERLRIPASWKAPRRVFVNSMSDLFHKDVPEGFVLRCFEVMLRVDRHVYQVLTKRPARAAKFVGQHDYMFSGGLPNHIWIGTSVEDQAVDYRIRHLLAVPASVRFLSCEPLIGPLDLTAFMNDQEQSSRLHWVIAGGESGSNARPMHPRWARDLRDQCSRGGVPFFFKQWGGRTPKAGGRELDGHTWDEYPETDPLSRYERRMNGTA